MSVWRRRLAGFALVVSLAATPVIGAVCELRCTPGSTQPSRLSTSTGDAREHDRHRHSVGPSENGTLATSHERSDGHQHGVRLLNSRFQRPDDQRHVTLHDRWCCHESEAAPPASLVAMRADDEVLAATTVSAAVRLQHARSSGRGTQVDHCPAPYATPVKAPLALRI